MRAITLDNFDSGVALRERPMPDVGARELLIRVRAASVNGLDRAIAAGAMRGRMEHEFPVTLGRDLAGVVERVGAAVTAYAPGDEVFGYVTGMLLRDGTFADYVVLGDDAFLAAKPAALGFAEAAALPLAATTALLAVEHVAPRPGEHVLVAGASGGVGGYAVQLAAAAGAHVIATALADDVEHLREIGAAETVDREGDVAAQVRAALAGGLDGLVDAANDPGGFATLTRVLKPTGRAASTRHAADPERDARTANVLAALPPNRMPDVAALAEAGRLRPIVRERRALEDALELFDGRRGHVQGKIVVEL